MRRDFFGRCFACAALLAGLAACSTIETTQPGVVGVDRRQTVSPLVDRNKLTQQASLQYRQVVGEAQKKGQLNVDRSQTERVRRISARLIPAVASFRPEAVSWKWETNVITSKEVNAWCMPGGKIAVYSGLIEQLKATDDELAAVMGHEIAHALREHAWERASQAANAQVGMTIAAIALGMSGVQQDAAGMAYNAMFALPNSREHETEADRIGVELAARAGYNPHAAVSLWEKMGKLDGKAPPQWLSTHPSQQTRVRDLTIYAEKVMPLYEKAKRR